MQLSPEQQNRHLAVAVSVCMGFALLVGLTLAWMSHNTDALVTVLILGGIFVVVEVVCWYRALRRRSWLKAESRQWLSMSGPDDLGD